MTYIDVQYIGGSSALLTVYPSKEDSHIMLQCSAIVGKNGIGKTQEGDYKTPNGEFGFRFAFGMPERPLTNLDYIQITDTMYWSDTEYKYNQLVDRTNDPICQGEHLIDYPDAYQYAMVLDYNKECQLSKGSAIFLHCSIPGRPYTAGCIAVSTENMLTLLRICDKLSRINIHS